MGGGGGGGSPPQTTLNREEKVEMYSLTQQLETCISCYPSFPFNTFSYLCGCDRTLPPIGGIRMVQRSLYCKLDPDEF